MFDPQNAINFEQLYLAIREKENRVYTDAEVGRLPDIPHQHVHYKEWQIRKRSACKLVSYLKKKRRPLNILEVGCGNGWLAAQLSTLPNARVTGIDINDTEIKQARRVFKKQNLRFVYAAFNKAIDIARFDIVVFAACLPYFQLVDNTLQLALGLLNPGGEVHVVDTHFYTPDEVPGAAQRCAVYYQQLGFPWMSSRYFHHTINCFNRYKHKVITNPRSLLNRLVKKEPFYWITINN